MNAKTSDTIHITCNIDSNYVKYCTVMLTSLLENNSSENFHIHIIGPQLTDDDRRKLQGVVERKYGQACSFYSPDETLLSMCRMDPSCYISIATYYRVFLDRILPADIDKVIYLDCDIIVNGPIREFWEQDISGVSIGAVDDMSGGVASYYERLHYSPEHGYFNAGVLLMNLAKLRRDGFSARASEFLEQRASELAFFDQDLLNALLHTDKKMLPLRWNIQHGFLRRNRSKRMTSESLQAVEREIKETVIVHYTGSKKPWQYKSQHPWRQLYFKYLDMTEYRGERPAVPVSYRALSMINSLLELLRLRKRRYFKYEYRSMTDSQ